MTLVLSPQERARLANQINADRMRDYGRALCYQIRLHALFGLAIERSVEEVCWLFVEAAETEAESEIEAASE